MALNLARQAADKRRTRRQKLSRSEALREAPWFPELAQAGITQGAFRAAYADRLIERGLALPSTAELPRPSGPSGQAHHPLMQVRVPREVQARYRAAAEREGLTLSAWVRRELDWAVGK